MHYQHPKNGWLPADASRYCRWADAPSLCQIWCKVANGVFAGTNDKGLAVRAANAALVLERQKSGSGAGEEAVAAQRCGGEAD